MIVTHQRALHAFCLLWVLAMLAWARLAPDAYGDAMQEDRPIEWATAMIFAVAGILRLRAAIGSRRLGDGLVGMFCVVVAGEEISWGQRILGFTPPAPFLEHNAQQELTLHNLASFFGQPKWVLAGVLLLYGVVLPASQVLAAGRALAGRLRLGVPPAYLIAWFAICVLLLVWYPVDFTGEWVELLAGALFLASTLSPGVRFWQMLATGAAAGILLTLATARRVSDTSTVACARDETRALVHDLVAGRAANESLIDFHEIDKRMLSAADAGYFDYPLLRTFRRIACSGESESGARVRRRHIVDPWGTAYWLRSRRDSAGGGVTLEVYSFGANRRRDSDILRSDRGDDVVVAGRYDPRSGESVPR